MRCLLSIDDLTDGQIARLLVAARRDTVDEDCPILGWPFTVGLVFLSPSLRTRVGFSVATCRLGGTPIDVQDRRWDRGMSAAESLGDTLRSVSGMVDIVVARVPFELERSVVASCCIKPFVNGGDDCEHPTQALIDLLAIEEERGPLSGLRIGVCGDLGSRTTRSLLKVLERRPPAHLRLMSPQERRQPDLASIGPAVQRAQILDHFDPTDLDVLYLSGLPEGHGATWLSAERRADFVLDRARVAALPPDAVILSPLPVIDEIAASVRADPRMRFFAQSDRGVAIRTAVLRVMLGSTRP